MGDLRTEELIETVMKVLETTYGNLGFLSFRLHSVHKNSKENIFIIKYSFVPRSPEQKRIFYRGKINVKDKSFIEIQEITEPDLAKDDEH